MLRGLQALVVDRVKKTALRQLHTNPHGEALILQLYLVAEQSAETAAPVEELVALGPAWLAAQVERHAADERVHVDLFRSRLGELVDGTSRVARWLERLGQLGGGKFAKLEALVQETAPRFAAGRRAPLLAIALRLERMGVRVFARHAAVLESMKEPEAPTYAILSRVLHDERRHVAECEQALDRLVSAGERQELARLDRRMERIERSFGVSEAIAMLALGLATRLSSALVPS